MLFCCYFGHLNNNLNKMNGKPQDINEAGPSFVSPESDIDEDPFHTDEDSDYNPNSESESSDAPNDNNNLTQVEKRSATPKRTRKRSLNIDQWKRMKRKKLRSNGKEYVTQAGKTVKKRELKEYEHSCRYDCKKISKEERETLFTKFYEIESYDLQTNFLASCITKKIPNRIKPTAYNKKNYVTKITLLQFRVCKEFFLRTFDITNRRFNTVCNKISNEGFVQTDQRGKHIPPNKKSNETCSNVMRHIASFPRYLSHYSRPQNCNTRYLSEDLNIRKMYSLYREWCTEQNIEPVKESYYRKIFCTKFNLKFHKPHSDTCHTCDKLNNLIKCTTNEDLVKKHKFELELHQRKAQSVLQAKKRDISSCETNENTRIICFDLQKTLPTPLLTTNKIFYLRQLWTYNFCIYDLISGKSYMYIWNETIASRGSQEIGSCLLKFINELPSNITHLICYSDSCGGQNKNKNIAKLFMYLVQCTSLTQIDHKFFEPGHSYMECDRSFGLIEKRKKKVPQIYIPAHWAEIIKTTSKKFVVYEMKNDDFYSFDHLHTLMKDPKKSRDNNPLKWRDIVWFSYQRDNFLSFEYKYSRSIDVPFVLAEKCSTLQAGRPSMNVLNFKKKLNSDNLKIAYAKWENLIQLLPFIPPVYHDFYKNMAHESKGQKKKKDKKQAGDNDDNEGEEFVDSLYALESDYAE